MQDIIFNEETLLKNEKTEEIIYDYSKLSGRILEICGTQFAFAEKIGLSDRSVTYRMRNQREWKQGDIEKALVVLGLNHLDIPTYFFTRKSEVATS